MAGKTAAHETRDNHLARLSRIEGQVRGISRMIQAERPCGEILAQMRSAIHALCRVQDLMLHQHLRRCVRESFDVSGSDERDRKAEEIFVLLNRYREP